MRWVVAFARTFFTAASVFVDTTVQHPAAYERLGPYDASAGAAASYRPTSSTRDGIDAGDAHRCAKASCDGAYYAALCVEINHWFGGSPPNFRTLYLDRIEVDSADFRTNRLLSSSSRSTAKMLVSKRSHPRTLKSG